ncbi:MAG: DegT/DnrJ/EryC1/StrS family aminotransferase [Clostridia bacterium]|nr:DegT/DnrJ/EryC1/StrS family aminotransferase [Clostridia bacterium]
MPVLAKCGGTPLRSKKPLGWTVASERDREGLREVYDGSFWAPGGEKEKEFCEEFAAFSDVKHCFTVANGTVSIQLILRALGIGYGDEVIVPPYTFIASVSSLIYAGVTPVFADIDPETFQLSPAAAERAITPRTKAIMPVYVGGRPADLDAFVKLCEKYGLVLIGDAAQAVGAKYCGRGVAHYAKATSISCQNSKNLTCGEGGLILSDDDAFAESLSTILNGGVGKDGKTGAIGCDFGISAFQASVLSSQLEALPAQIEKRSGNAAYLDRRLGELDFVYTLANDPKITVNAYHLYMFGLKEEKLGGISLERFVSAVRAEGAPVSTGYKPVCTFPCVGSAYAEKCVGGKIYTHPFIPAAERVSAHEACWIYQSWLLGSKEDMDDIVNALVKVYENRKELIEGGEAK